MLGLLTLNELREAAKAQGLKGYSKMSKDEIKSLLELVVVWKGDTKTVRSSVKRSSVPVKSKGGRNQVRGSSSLESRRLARSPIPSCGVVSPLGRGGHSPSERAPPPSAILEGGQAETPGGDGHCSRQRHSYVWKCP